MLTKNKSTALIKAQSIIAQKSRKLTLRSSSQAATHRLCRYLGIGREKLILKIEKKTVRKDSIERNIYFN